MSRHSQGAGLLPWAWVVIGTLLYLSQFSQLLPLILSQLDFR